MEISKTWEELKDLAVKKQLGFQYEYMDDTPERYLVFIQENTTDYFSKFNADSVAGSEFAGSFQDSANNPATIKTTDAVPYVRVTAKSVGLVMKIHGGEFTAGSDTITKSQMKYDADIEIVGCIVENTGGHHGDKLQVKYIDVDNILGYGSGTVLAHFAIDVPAQLCNGTPIDVESTTADLIYEGLYMSIEYENNHATEDVDVHYVYKYYK